MLSISPGQSGPMWTWLLSSDTIYLFRRQNITELLNLLKEEGECASLVSSAWPSRRWWLLSNINSCPPKAASYLTVLAIALVPRVQLTTESGMPLSAGEMFMFCPLTTSTLKQELWLCTYCLDTWNLAANTSQPSSTPFPRHICFPLLPHLDMTMRSEVIPWHQEKLLTWSCIFAFPGRHPRLRCPLPSFTQAGCLCSHSEILGMDLPFSYVPKSPRWHHF